MDLDSDSPPWKRQEAHIEELELLVAVLVARHGTDGRYVMSMGELDDARRLLQHTPVVAATFGPELLILEVF